ncbi:helix-turn-helix domain-containing protein [Sorangium sp. So ce363]|uniref:helix-turn-helix domain-containing protein n=1 Tax=Sorangium sp. So ce363 TaxID=3133304 RepID=UPI003F620F0E
MKVVPIRGGGRQGGDPPSARPRPTLSMGGEEAQRLRAALRSLRSMAGSTRCLAEMLGMGEGHLQNIICGRRPSYGVAVRAAKLAGVTVERLLGGLAAADRCPTCGARRGAP